MDDDLLASNAAWRSIPLCTEYCVVRFEALPVQSKKDDVASQGTVLWAFGVLSDSQHEVLGAWPVPEPAKTEWAEVFDDLQWRGVERIGSVVSGGPSLDAAALRKAYPSAVSLGAPPAAKAVSRTHRAVSHRTDPPDQQFRPPVRVSMRQRIVCATEGAVKRLHSRVSSAVARYGAFSNLEAARSFVIGELRRAERKLAPFRLDASAPVNSRSRRCLSGAVG